MVCMKLNILLTSIDSELAQAWERWCGDLLFVSVHHGSILDLECDAIVSPANSFGFMDGGIDRVYLEHFGHALQDRVQDAIKRDHGGELLVGAATIVETLHTKIPYLIAAPTMRVPMVLSDSPNPYLATRAVFRLIRDGKVPNGVAAREVVASVAFPGMGTGVGRVPAVLCAKQVRAAIEDVVLGRGRFPESCAQAVKRHDKLTQRRLT